MPISYGREKRAPPNESIDCAQDRVKGYRSIYWFILQKESLINTSL